MADVKLRTKVDELIRDAGQKEKIFDSLRKYQTEQDLAQVLHDLRNILDEPCKLELFDHMRPLILLHHQLEYSQQVPSVPGVKARIVRLYRTPHEGLGFAVRGGSEHGVGVFVTDVRPGSQADCQGLMVGDEIVGVNGFTISEAIHDDVLSLIKARDDIVLKVTHIGMLPVKENPNEELVWRYVQKEHQDDSVKPKDLKIFIDSSGHHSLGCGILSGPAHLPGIFVEKVRAGSVAEEVNLEPGDQIVEVNNTVFSNITHKEAVLALVSCRQLHLTIRKGVGIKLMQQQIPNKRDSSVNEGSGNISRQETSADDTSATNQKFMTLIPVNQNTKIQNANGKPPLSTNTCASERETRDFPSPSSSLSTTAVEVYPEKPSSSYSSSSPSSSQHSLGEDVADEQRNTRESNRDSGFELREEIRNRIGSNLSSPISGAEAILQQRKLKNSAMPDLLGCGDDDFCYSEKISNKIYDKFTVKELDGRALHSLAFNKKSDLGITLEGGLGTPLDGRVVVAMIFEDGVARRSGKMKVGDQVMSVNGKKLVNVTVAQAYSTLQDQTAISQETVELIFCASTLVNEEESVTYF